ncbi:MAG: hypothetical protein ABFS56_31960 [Pseudomonadota bacterium]
MKFRKILLQLCVISGISVSIFPLSGYAEKIAFEKGDKVFQAGLGLGSGYRGIYGDSTTPVISGAFDLGYSDRISIGGIVSYTSSEDMYSFYGNRYGWEYSYLGIAARGAYHYGIFDSDKIDTYAGIALGYNTVTVSNIGSGHRGSASGSYLLYGGFVGLRYFFKPNLAVFTELGYGLGLGTVGLSLKF